MTNITCSHFYQWGKFSDEEYPKLMDEFVRGGAKRVVLGHLWAKRIIDEPDFWAFLCKLFERSGLQVSDAHAFFGEHYGLNTPDPSARQNMLTEHKRVIELFSSIGGKVITMHIGDCHAGYSRDELRRLTVEALTELLPVAEKHDVVIAIENTLEPGVNSADELLYYQSCFKTDFLGFCFDSGHANFLEQQGNKVFSEETLAYLNKGSFGKFEFQKDTLEKMLPHIVTVHLHDNSGYGDEHKLPGDGTIDWSELMQKLKTAPRLMTIQNETNAFGYNISIEKICTTFNTLLTQDNLK